MNKKFVKIVSIILAVLMAISACYVLFAFIAESVNPHDHTHAFAAPLVMVDYIKTMAPVLLAA